MKHLKHLYWFIPAGWWWVTYFIFQASNGKIDNSAIGAWWVFTDSMAIVVLLLLVLVGAAVED